MAFQAAPTITTNVATVSDEAGLNGGDRRVPTPTPVAGTYTIDISGTITEGTDTRQCSADLYAINLQPGVSLVIGPATTARWTVTGCIAG